MAITDLSTVIIPEIFASYIINETMEKSTLINSGIAVSNPALNALITGGGNNITMPQWNDLSGESQVVTVGNPLKVDGITASADIATVLIRANAWGAHQLVGALAGDDPMKAIAKLTASWWLREEQKILLNTLSGVFKATSMVDLVNDVGASKGFDASLVLDSKQRLGDRADQLTTIVLHSLTYTALQKQGAIIMVPSGIPDLLTGKLEYPTYLGYRVLVDDTMPVDNTDTTNRIFTTYLFANGVIGRGEGIPTSMKPVATDNDILAHTEYLVNTRALVLHPMGIKWKGTSTGATPSNAELSTGTNWERVNDVKKIGIVQIKHGLTI